LDNQQVFFTNTTNVSWEQRITSGTGASQGLELEINYITDNFYLDIAYTFSKSERTIQNSNGLVETFRYKFDRPHDLAVSCTYSLRSNKYFNLSWVFGNGNRWTYPDISVGGNLQFTTRNNTELTNYHHLDISYTVEKEILRPKDLQLVFGIYNIYNNRNPFYAYPIIGENVPFGTAEQVSLYPIFPQITARFSW